MRLGLSQSARLEQRLVQSPQMIQAMQILQLSTLDLEHRVAEELLENPFLEVDESRAEEEAPAPEGPARDADAVEGMVEVLERYERDFGDGRAMRPARSDDGERKLEAMQNTPATYHSLGDALMDQIALADFDVRRRAIAEFLAYSLDHRGYLPEPLETLAAECDIDGVTVEELAEVLEALRRATHPALGARDLRECLLLQLGPLHLDIPLIRTLLHDHIEDITTNRLPRIARTTGYSIEDIKEAIGMIRTLDPVPGREYGEAPAETIHPDVVVEEVDGSFEVRLTREGVPRLTVSSSYKSLLRQTPKGDAVHQWVKQRLENARWFIDALEQRESTLLRIARAIFGRQRPFLQRGIKALQPLRMLEVADETAVHISTVSRAVAGKYAQTPHGILPLRFFFSGGTAKASGGMASQASIKQRIREMVEQEDAASPLSDDRLAEVLRERDGIKIARRTITKYRKALGIPASSQRRRF
ncbi:MAG: RNA polymerase factor sigma-54 [Planctomycetota bacterium]